MSSHDAHVAVHEQLFARRMVVVDRPLDAETATLVAARLLALVKRRLIERDIDRGRVLSAVDAVTYGLADEVVEPRSG